MADRRPLVLISGVFSELPQGDTAIGASAGTLTAGSGVAGGGALDGTARRLDIALAANASGLIIVGDGDSATLGFDGSHVASGSAALALAGEALASGNAALTLSTEALASGDAALASGNAALSDLSSKVSKAGDVVSGTLVVTSQSYGTVGSFTGSGVITLDFGANNNHVVTLQGNSTLAAPTTASGGQAGAVVIHQDGTGSRTLAYSGGWSFAGGTAPTLTTTASGTDILVYYCSDSSTFNASTILDVQSA
jgi:hypothetical protein